MRNMRLGVDTVLISASVVELHSRDHIRVISSHNLRRLMRPVRVVLYLLFTIQSYGDRSGTQAIGPCITHNRGSQLSRANTSGGGLLDRLPM